MTRHPYSVVMACRSSDQFLRAALTSIFEQSLQPSEVILVADSIDEGIEEVRIDVKEMFPKVEFVKSQGKGMMRALNTGILRASHDFVSFLDSDDLWMPLKQERQIYELARDPLIDVVTGNAMNFKDGGLHFVEDIKWVKASLFTCSTFRAQAFEKYGLIDETASHFTWLYRWWSCAVVSGIRRIHLDLPSIMRRIHTSNSWVIHNASAHNALMRELRSIMNPRTQD